MTPTAVVMIHFYTTNVSPGEGGGDVLFGLRCFDRNPGRTRSPTVGARLLREEDLMSEMKQVFTTARTSCGVMT